MKKKQETDEELAVKAFEMILRGIHGCIGEEMMSHFMGLLENSMRELPVEKRMKAAEVHRALRYIKEA